MAVETYAGAQLRDGTRFLVSHVSHVVVVVWYRLTFWQTSSAKLRFGQTLDVTAALPLPQWATHTHQ